ncbi:MULTISPECIES: glycerophosphodiester phosphodiesterase [Enterococcus]|uniref:glycerophosphodiester phosphodiesterase n=1 Tax=Enterococcus TaxID=1350 RepID=UPI000CF2E07E|nr:glycerophosphodiester phosphodiesterase family protein [Enterococcus faecium]PQC90990.1 glycerophosphodiester phosphodiesterase [Enterococcus faecium]PQD56030.1 glycerophosphodiester phosphodiesterase [Enterococcus faecium]ROY02762.1 glycerophosphodiester phosphodiesterase [Enterococcus faecium]ROY10191.1 glycerophosphodiester phosphodiesterase [Enterococcus faecium]
MKKILGTLIAFSFVLTGCVSASNNLLSHKETYLVAHRGAHIVAPENTVEAMREAKLLGYNAVEVDVRTSKDGVNFLMHDDTLDRTTNGEGQPERLTIKQLKELSVDTSNYPKYKDKKVNIPTFDEAIKEISKDKLIVNVDGSKGEWDNNDFVNSIVSTLKKYNVYDRSFFVLTNKEIRDNVVKSHPDCTVSWLYDSKNSIDDEIQQVKQYNKALLSVSNTLATDQLIEKLNKSGIMYQIYGVNDIQRFKKLKSLDVPIVETDTINPNEI